MLIIGISGGSGSGKSTFVEKIAEKLPKTDVVSLPLDNYYKDHSYIPADKRKDVNFDHPDAIDFELLIEHLKILKEGKPVQMPDYSFITSTRSDKTTPVFPKSVIIIEGILTFCNDELREVFDIKIFIDSEPDVRLSRILKRDIYERGKNFAEVLTRYEKIVKPMHLQFIEPSRKYADFIIPCAISDEVSTHFIVTMIKNQLLKQMK